MSNMLNKLEVPQFNNDEQSTLNAMWSQLQDRADHNALRSAYYNMKHTITSIGNVVPPSYYRQASVLGWTGKAVDALARRCTFEGAYMPDLDVYGYEAFAEDNGLPGVLRSAIVGSLVHGSSFLINDPVMRSDEETSHATWGDAATTTGLWGDSRRTQLSSALSVNEWREGNNRVPSKFTYYTPGLVVEVVLEDGQYVVDAEYEHDYGMPVEVLSYKPFLRQFGSSRITPAMMQLQDRGMAGLIRLEAHMDIYAIPDLWLLGADQSIFQDSSGAQQTAWQVMMGRIKAVPDDDELLEAGGELARMARPDVKQFAASAPDPHLASINAIAKLFCREADLPDNALAITDVANPTAADSYVESREALIAEAEGSMDDWSPSVKRFVTRALAIQNDDPNLITGDLRQLEMTRRSPVYTSRAAAADAGAKQLAAAPEWLRETTVGLELLGLSPQQIRRALAEKSEQPPVIAGSNTSLLNSKSTEEA